MKSDLGFIQKKLSGERKVMDCPKWTSRRCMVPDTRRILMKWISVEDELPGCEKLVIACVVREGAVEFIKFKRASLATYSCGNKQWNVRTEEPLGEVLYWCPIPDLPNLKR